ncbi:hypothetical protein [Rhizobium leguminosarum]|uniref:hypothetical protein n=1 Tax=Rhizobium leguminosarum TaxID=384 RepID=UPI001C8FFB4F|nr:hypothetical protein [Rhizobium leguminosarum]MBY2975518.1 hypothetical protein [Rhizobium leguminosarum]
MKTKTTVFRGLTFDVLVEEAQSMDAQGGQLWYLAAVYVRDRSGARHLVRKSRLPGAAEELAALVRRDGIRVFDQFKVATRTDVGAEAVRPAPSKHLGQPRQRQPVASPRAPAP